MRRTARRLATSAALFAATTVGMTVAPTWALAHARVLSTSPGAGATVTGSITQIVIRFDDVITLVPHALTVTTDMGQPVGLESPRVVAGKTLRAFVQDRLAPGDYAVAWRIMADDGHIESATFTFRVAGAVGRHRPSAAGAPAPPPAPAQPLWPVLVAAGVALAAGLGAGVAVHRGLRAAGLGPAYPAESTARAPQAAASAEDAMLRLPM